MANKKFTPEQKIAAVMEHRAWKFTRPGKIRFSFWTVESICRKYGIRRSHLDAWGRLFDERGADVFTHGKLHSRIRAQTGEIVRLRETIEKLEEENELLRIARASEAT